MDSKREVRLRRLRDSAEMWLGTADPALLSGAMIETAFLMAAADGELSDLEMAHLATTVEALTGDQVGSVPLEVMLAQLLESLQSDGWSARIEAVARSMPNPLDRRNAYRLAAGVSFVDGVVQQAEVQLFGLLAEAFGIPTDEASHLLEEVRNQLFDSWDDVTENVAQS